MPGETSRDRRNGYQPRSHAGPDACHHIQVVHGALRQLLGRRIKVLDCDDPSNLLPAGSVFSVDLLIALNSADKTGSAHVLRILRETQRGARVGIVALEDATPPSFAFVRRIGRQAPADNLYFVSDRLWYLGDRLSPFERYCDAPSRRYFFGNGLWAKITSKNGDAENRARYAATHFNEVTFLSRPPSDFPAPRLVANGEDLDCFWLIRELIEGKSLYELITSGAAIDDDRVISDVLTQLVVLERNRLYYDDLRAHNVVLRHDGATRLIDYGSVSPRRSDCMYPDDLFLVFLQFVFELTCRFDLGAIPHHLPTCRAVMLNVTALPHLYRGVFEAFLAMRPEDWTFAELKRLLDLEKTRPSPASSPLPQGVYLLAEKLQGAVAAHQQEILRMQREITNLQTLNAELRNANTSLATKVTELDKVYPSLAWKVIKPLRAMKKAVQSLFAT